MRTSLIISLVVLTVLSACSNRHSMRIFSSQEMLVDSLPGQCPFLTRDTKGQTIMSWVRMNHDSTAAFCYAISPDGKKFGRPIVVPNSGNIQPHGENLPKVIFKPSGEIIALWGAANPNPRNKYSGLVFYVQSFDDGKTWTTPKPLTADTSSYDQRYYDVALLPNGEAAIVWLDNRKSAEKEGAALYYARTEGRLGFTGEKKISEGCCPCCRTDLFVDRKGGVHVMYRGILENSIRDMVHIVSTDGGKIFSAPRRISQDNWVLHSCPHTGPAMTENNTGLHFAWFTGGNNAGCFYTQSINNGNSFGGQDSVSSLGSHPQMAATESGEVVIVWDEFVQSSNNQPCKKIGVQERDANGKALARQFITADSLFCTYPVVAPSGEGHSIVAYTSRKGKENYIAYQLIGLGK